MKLEFVLKYKCTEHDSWNTKYRFVCDDDGRCPAKYSVYSRYDAYAYKMMNSKKWFDFYICVNRLEDDCEFIEVVL